MLTSLIEITPAADRRGANQMRQQLSLGEHFWRGNAGGHRSRRRRPDCVLVASIPAGWNDGGQFVEVELDDRL
jgi:hypothetical protein